MKPSRSALIMVALASAVANPATSYAQTQPAATATTTATATATPTTPGVPTAQPQRPLMPADTCLRTHSQTRNFLFIPLKSLKSAEFDQNCSISFNFTQAFDVYMNPNLEPVSRTKLGEDLKTIYASALSLASEASNAAKPEEMKGLNRQQRLNRQEEAASFQNQVAAINNTILYRTGLTADQFFQNFDATKLQLRSSTTVSPSCNRETWASIAPPNAAHPPRTYTYFACDRAREVQAPTAPTAP